VIHWLAYWTGLTNGSGPRYLWWSGIGSDIGEVALLGGLIQIYRHTTCHVQGCYRIGRHKVAGTEHVTCRKHHPDDAPTHAQVLADHRSANG
jgi:hypothetical protein